MPIPIQTTTEKPSNSESLPATSTESTSNSAVHQAATSAGVASDQISGGSPAQGKTRSEVEKAADKLYEERIEDEYAKREGGA
ncbi:MAG: hypothetical protein M1812_001797 [Candelaria pacifica]|nr:MAG: hypothetical protein M1812_001797 [Candelaria pacifica]